MSDVEQATEEEIDIDDDGTEKPVKNQTFAGKFCANAILKVIFSTPGLVILVVIYSIMGALIFPLLEAPREVKNVAAIAKSREDCLKELWTITEKLNVLYEKNWTMLVHEQLRRFEGSIVAATRNGINVGNDRSPRWSFSEALLYSVTVITTIGHGNLSPKTSSGKVVTILYALIGVPLMLMCLSSLGGLLADALQCTYTRICCGRKRDSNITENVCTGQSYEMNCNLCKYDAVCNETKLHGYEYATVNDREDSCRLIHNSPSKINHSSTCIQLKSNTLTSPIKRQQHHQQQQQQQYSPIHQQYSRSGLSCRGNSNESGLELTVTGTTYYPGTQTVPTNNHFTCNSTGIFNHPANMKYHGLQLHPQLQHNKGYGGHQDHHSTHTATVHGIRRGKFLPKPMPQEINMLLAESDMSYHHEPSTNSSGNVDIMADEEEENELNRIGCPHGTPSRIPLISSSSSSGNSKNNIIGMEIELDNCNHNDDDKNNCKTITLNPSQIKSNNHKENDSKIIGNVPQVPIIIVLIILISYIGIGTVIFSLWENWSFIDGAYFCFVTLSTIGYGDFLPQQTFHGPDLQLFACCAYLLLGLVLVAMSFSLLETQLLWKCKQIAVRLKLAKD